MGIDIRTKAKIAAAGVAGLAAVMFSAPNAFADPQTPDTTVPPPPPDAVAQAAPVPHLPSPDNLPPGTSDTPVPGTPSPGAAYAKSVWQAIRDHDITWREGLILLAQRPMNPNAAPPPGLAAGPQDPPPADPPPPPPTP